LYDTLFFFFFSAEVGSEGRLFFFFRVRHLETAQGPLKERAAEPFFLPVTRAGLRPDMTRSISVEAPCPPSLDNIILLLGGRKRQKAEGILLIWKE